MQEISSTMAAAAIPAPVNSNVKAVTPILQPIILPHPGPFGMTLASADGGSCVIIEKVVPQSQADRAGLRADLPVVSMGMAIPYRNFLQMCQAATRPVLFGVMRGAISSQAAIASNSKSSSFALAPTTAKKEPQPAKANAMGGIATTNENAPNGTVAAAVNPSNETAGAVARVPPVLASFFPSVTVLLAMSNTQLRNQLDVRNIKVNKNATKDVMLENLGLPITQWHVWRKILNLSVP